ncbi:MAG: hypothetical protein BAJALOKI1v1_370003 [Promethearchaeota archaeon]|nr:MAG: hypothetical protein BAJALOKI1v1_370003 [Candidatus Lokiarchaeota archaeon]
MIISLNKRAKRKSSYKILIMLTPQTLALNPNLYIISHIKKNVIRKKNVRNK